MGKLQWDKIGEHFYENGVDHGVLYPMNADGQTYGNGVAWNGLTAVTESPEGAEVSAIYADNIKYLNLMSAEDFKATIEAYTYPEAFEQCDGSASLAEGVKIGQQARKAFGFCYRTKVGNDLNPDLGYKIHIIYGATAAPSERAYETVNDSPEAITFSWEISTIPVEVTGFKPTAHLEIDSTKVSAEALAQIEAKLYGSESEDAVLLTPDEIVEIISGGSHSKLDAPVLSANDTDQELTITVDASSGAESFDIYESSTYVKNVAKTAAATVVSYASLGYTTAGSHYLKAKAQGGSHLDSDFSNRVKITVQGE